MTKMLSNLKKGYLILPLSERALALLGRVAHRKTQIKTGAKTETHTHRLFSFYIVENMEALQTPDGNLELPERALVVVLPKVLHGWTNQAGHTDRSYVYDLTPMHPPHVVYA